MSSPVVRAWQGTVNKRKRKWDDRKAKLDRANMACQTTFCHLDEGALSKHHCHLREKLGLFQDRTMEAKRKYNKADRELQRKRNRQIREILERYRNEQPVIDLERQLAGKLVDTKVMGALEHKGFMPPQHLTVIDATLSMPGATLEGEYWRQFNTINAMTAFRPVEEGRPTPQLSQSCCRSVPDEMNPVLLLNGNVISRRTRPRLPCAKQWNPRVSSLQKSDLSSAFFFWGMSISPQKYRIAEHATPGSLTRHFLRKHVNPPWPTKGVECNVCGMELLKQKFHLLNHAEVPQNGCARFYSGKASIRTPSWTCVIVIKSNTSNSQ